MSKTFLPWPDSSSPEFQEGRLNTEDHSAGFVVNARMVFWVFFVLIHMAIASQIYWLSSDILEGDGSCDELTVSLRYPPMRVPETPITMQYQAQGRLCADFAQIYFPSQKKMALKEAYAIDTTLDPWLRPSKYPPLMHFIFSYTLCRLPYGQACLLHLAVQTVLFIASFVFAFFVLRLRKYLMPSLLLLNVCLFLTPVGLSFFERGQFTLYLGLCYLWLMLALVTGKWRYSIVTALFGFLKWTSFPVIVVVLSVYLIHSKNWQEIRERLVLSVLCFITIMLLFFTLARDGMFFLEALFEQELTFVPMGITLLQLLPRFIVKTVPFFLVGVGLVNRLCFKQDVSSLLPFFAGSAIMLLMYPTFAFDYSDPCLLAFVPFMIHWAKSPGVDRSMGRVVLTLFIIFLIVASDAITVLGFSEREDIIMYIIMSLVLVGTPFLVPKRALEEQPSGLH